jgi:tRNA (cytidine/uridine-2'-O-)-methyltransferase
MPARGDDDHMERNDPDANPAPGMTACMPGNGAPAHRPALVLYQPDIAQNTGTLARASACFGTELHIIEPAGFDVSDRNFRRAGMDYIARAAIIRHDSWERFHQWRLASGRRLLLAETDGATSFAGSVFASGDLILLGRESAGVPDAVRALCDHVVAIPQVANVRSLNVALAGAILLAEALRQTQTLPPHP